MLSANKLRQHGLLVVCGPIILRRAVEGMFYLANTIEEREEQQMWRCDVAHGARERENSLEACPSLLCSYLVLATHAYLPKYKRLSSLSTMKEFPVRDRTRSEVDSYHWRYLRPTIIGLMYRGNHEITTKEWERGILLRGKSGVSLALSRSPVVSLASLQYGITSTSASIIGILFLLYFCEGILRKRRRFIERLRGSAIQRRM
ncbi:hypothetical protein DFS33DRAFT_1278032 [Desarmillaria ectypa]|nr:hypothetical protein DFS33DRAFT_1278032 [Desarmillaria ectypa]